MISNFKLKISNFLAKLRSLPEKQKIVIFFAIIAIFGVALIFWSIKITRDGVSKIRESVKSINLSQFKILENQQIDNQEKYFNDTDADKEINNTTDGTNKIDNKNSDLKTYKNEPYGFTIDYPKDWGVDSNQTNDLHLWLQKEISKEVASLHIEVASQTQNTKSTEDGVSYIISQMKDITKQEKVKIGEFDGYEVIGMICTQICKESLDDPYFPFSVIYFSHNDTVLKIKYSEGTLGIGWKDTIKDWKYYDEYQKIISTFRFGRPAT